MEKKVGPALPAEDLSVICAQLALMQGAGIGAEDAVSLMLEDVPAKHQAMLSELNEALSRGVPLDAAMRECRVFPPYMVQMVSIGLLSGTLDRVLKSLSVYYRREADTTAAIRRTVVYPAFMAILITAVFLVLISRVLPVFQQVFSQLGISLSPAAQTMLMIGSASRQIAAVFSALMVLAALFLLYILKTKRGAALGARLSRKLFSSFAAYKAVDRGHFANAISLMLSSGFSLDEAMEKSEELLSGSALSSAVAKCRKLMAEGVNFPKAVKEVGLFSGLEAGLVSAGFRAGNTEKAMDELSNRAQKESQDRLDSLLGRLELTLVMVLCIAVGFVLLSVMLPLLGVMTAIGG
ncbi:MAG: type II secretion system F family protein [Oscillospiraceae bacterium]